MNAYLLYHRDVETTSLPCGITVYHDRSRHNQDPYIFNERFLQTYCHMSWLRKRGIRQGDLYFWVSAGEGVSREKYQELLCDLVFEVEQPDVEWSHPNNLKEDDPIVDSKQVWEDHYSWAPLDHCLGYFVYLFQNQEGNDHAGNLITICPMHEWRRKGAGSVITGALFGTDVSSSQYRGGSQRTF